MHMKTIVRNCAIGAALIGIGAASTLALQQPEVGSTPPPMPDFSKVTKKDLGMMMEQMHGPAEEHKALEPLIGKSKLKSSLNVGPGVPPIVGHYEGSAEWILGKRFVQVRTVPAPGEEFKAESLSIYGYDTRVKKYFWIGIDTMGTYSVTAFGDYNAAKKQFTLMGENEEPGMGKIPFRNVITVKDDGTLESMIDFKMQGTEDWMNVATMKWSKVK